MGPELSYSPNFWSLCLIAPAIIAFALALETFKRKYGQLGRKFAILMAALGWWSLTYSFELASTEESAMRFWMKLEYLGIIFCAPMTYLVVRSFLGMPKLHPYMKLGLWIVPVLTLILQPTNDYHYLFYDAVVLTGNETRSWLTVHAGPWYTVDSVYVCLLGLLGLTHLVTRMPSRREPVLRRQTAFLIVALILPYAGFILYLLDVPWAPGIDLTTFFFLFSGFLLAIGIFHFQLFDVLPIALERVFENIGDACLVFDVRNRLVRANQSAKKLFTWQDIPLWENAELIWREYRMLLDAVTMKDGESRPVQIPRNSEERFWVVSRYDVENEDRGKIGFLLVVRDDTVQQRMANKLRELNAEKDKLFSVIGHDLRGSLAGLESLSEMLCQTDMDLSQEESRELLTAMRESSAATRSYLDNLLLWARIQRGDFQQEMKRLDVADVTKGQKAYLSSMLASKGLIFREEIEPGLAVEADRALIDTVLRNLLTNAVKFSPRGQTITFRAASDGEEQVRFEVQDRGIGIPAPMIQNLWKLSSRTGREGTEGEPSSGLGLVLVREAILSMNGTIQVESEEGQGTTFRFFISACAL